MVKIAAMILGSIVAIIILVVCGNIWDMTDIDKNISDFVDVGLMLFGVIVLLGSIIYMGRFRGN